MVCKYCKIETDKIFVFGLIEKQQFHGTDASLNRSENRALALLRVPCCDACSASKKSNSIKKTLNRFLIYLAVAFFSFLICRIPDIDNAVFQLFGTALVCSALGAVFSLIALVGFFMRGGFANIVASDCLALYEKEHVVDKDDIVVSSASDKITIWPVSRNVNTYNVWSVHYYCVSSVLIEKFRYPKKISFALTKQDAMCVLKKWYDAST